MAATTASAGVATARVSAGGALARGPRDTVHHISLNGHYYLVRPGSYVKKEAPQFGARFATGDSDYNNLSMWQHWAQKCFIGGMGQDEFADDAMYDEGVGVDTTDHEKVTLSRSLSRGTGSNWDLGNTAPEGGYKTIVYNSKLYAITIPGASVESTLWEYVPASDGWTQKTSIGGKNIRAMCVTVYDGKLWVGGVHYTTGLPLVIYDDGALTSWSTLALPATTGSGNVNSTYYPVHAMAGFQSKLYVAYGVRVWRFKDDQTKDGNTVFYKANASSASNYIVGMEVHLGFLYMLSQNGHVHRTDGNTTFDIWNWDGQTEGTAIKSFDGRLFILTFEYTDTADVGQGVLYQLSGSAVTQLKRWGEGTDAIRIGNMRVYDRKLWYGASNLLGFGQRGGFGVVAYDAIEDSHCIAASNSDTTGFTRGSLPYRNHIVDDQIFFNGSLFAFVRGHGAFRTPFKAKDLQRGSRQYDITAAGPAATSQAGGWFSTSTYDAGTPGVLKMWRKITIDVAIKADTSVLVDYSTDNGTTWANAGLTVAVVTRGRVEFFLNNVTSTSLKLRFSLRSVVVASSPTLYGFAVSYIPQPEPNWLWQFIIVLSERQVLLDGTEVTVDTVAELAFLSAMSRAKRLVSFTDAEGGLWASNGQPGVLVYDYVENLRDLNQPLEGEVSITLLEAVETY